MATPGTTIYGGSPHAQGQLAEHLAWLAESLRRVNLHGLAPEGCADSALDLASIRYLTAWLREQSRTTDRLVLLADYEAPADLAISQRIALG